MASEPDDYQTISDNCPGYMVLISAGIICTRCEGEKRHKQKDCQKPATATDVARETIPETDPSEHEYEDEGMESLSDTSSVSSESTVRSEGSAMEMEDAHQLDRQGSVSQDSHPPRHNFAAQDGRNPCAKPNRTISSPPNQRAASGLPLYDSSQVHNILIKAERQVSDKALNKSQTQRRQNTKGKFDYSSTTCPSSFGFGRLPSEAMG